MSDGQVVLLQELEQMKHSYGAGCARQCEPVLKQLRNFRICGRRFAHSRPRQPAVSAGVSSKRKCCETRRRSSRSICNRRLSDSLADPDYAEAFDDEAVSGIAGTTVTNNWTYELARRLFPGIRNRSPPIGISTSTTARWQQYCRTAFRYWPTIRFVEADTPYLRWIDAAAGGAPNDVSWLLNSFAALPMTPLHRTSLYDSLGINLHWRLGKLARQPHPGTPARLADLCSRLAASAAQAGIADRRNELRSAQASEAQPR